MITLALQDNYKNDSRRKFTGSNYKVKRIKMMKEEDSK